MIRRIKIKGYKSIKDQEVSLSPINLFIGGNGVGKSNFVSVFSFLRAIYEKNLSNYVIKKGGADNFLYFGKKQTQEILVGLNFGDETKDVNLFIVNLANAQDALFIKSIKTAFYNEKWHYTSYEKNVVESNFKNINHGQAYWVNERLKEFKVYHFHDTSDSSPIKGLSQVDDNQILKKDGANLASFLYFLKNKHSKHYNRIEKTIQSVAPFFEKFILEPSNLNSNVIKLKWQEKNSIDSYFDAYNLSDGTLRFMCLCTLLLQPNPPKTIIIDEPELGLHPVAINKLSGLIRKISHQSQLIISTQSINLIDNFEPKDIVVADRKNNETIFHRLDNNELEAWLKDYSLGDVWGKNIFGGQPFNY